MTHSPLDASEIILLATVCTVSIMLVVAVATSAIVAAIERTRPAPTAVLTSAQPEAKL